MSAVYAWEEEREPTAEIRARHRSSCGISFTKIYFSPMQCSDLVAARVACWLYVRQMKFSPYSIPLANTVRTLDTVGIAMTDAGSNVFNATRLKTRHLLLLLQLNEHRSVFRAAEAANMTQPAASKLLAEMENMFGVPLFDRHPRGVDPTWYGQALIRRARSAISEMSRAHDEIAALKSGRMGQAAIGTVVNPGTNLVPRAIAAVKRDFPDILIRVEMDYSRPLVAKLVDGQLDIVIGRILGPEGAGELIFEPLADEPHSVIVRTGHPLTLRASITHADLVEYGWIMPPATSVLRTRLDSMFLEKSLAPPKNIIETASLPVIIHLLRHSDLLTALPVEPVAPYVQTGQMQVLPIELGVRMEFFGIIRRRSHELSPASQRVLEALRDMARLIYSDLPPSEAS